MRRTIILCQFLFVALFSLQANAQTPTNFPTKNIEVIMPYGAGGATDLICRVISASLGKRVNQAVVVVNKPGANGLIASNYVKEATPDGYTLLFHAVSVAIDQSVKPNTGFDLRRDLLPITEAVAGIAGIFVRASLPVNTLPELIEYAKTNQKKLFYGSTGAGSPGHVVTEAFRLGAGIEMVHVPAARSVTQSIQAMASGEIDFVLTDLNGVMPFVQSGQVKLLAVTSNERSPDAPNVMTVAEAAKAANIPGLANFNYQVWYGFFAPAKTPPAVAQILNKEIVGAIKDASDALLKMGYRPHQLIGSSLPEFKQYVDEEVTRWQKVVADAKIPPQ